MLNLGGVFSSISDIFDFNKSFLCGCSDIIVFKFPDGSLKSTPWHIRFGKIKCLKSKGKELAIDINGRRMPYSMKLGASGEAFFEEKIINQTVNNSPLWEEGKMTEKNADLSSPTLNQGDSPSTASTNNKEDSAKLQKLLEFESDKNFQKDEQFKRTLRPNESLLKSFCLIEGHNEIVFTVINNVQGPQSMKTNLFLWPSDTKIIVCDIDGTITKSDVIGAIAPFMGKDWSHPGICSLLTNANKNGYHILYLTARAIGQADMTKKYIHGLKQDNIPLPLAPVLLAPDTLLPSFKREVILKKANVFKIAVLKDIKALYSDDYNPFHAGFGNRETDAISYRAIDIALEKIFIINTESKIYKVSDNSIYQTYLPLIEEIHEIFPLRTLQNDSIKD